MTSDRARQRTAEDSRERARVSALVHEAAMAEPLAALPPARGKPAFILRGLTVVVLLLVLIDALLGLYAYSVNTRLADLDAYVASRRAARDAENLEQDRRFAAAVCAVRDELPPAPSLDRLRATYGCGPGQIPFTPEETAP